MRLLLLEDDQVVGSGLRDYLCGDGFHVVWVTSLAQARTLINEVFDVWIFDWNLPDGSAVEFLRFLRGRNAGTPAVLLTARDSLADRVLGLDSGADDFLVKPFAPEELSARLRVIARRLLGGHKWVRLADVEIEISGKVVRKAGVDVALTAREWEVMEALLMRMGRVVSRADLERLVFSHDGDIHSNALEVHVSKLRQKLGPHVIQTVRGLGYRVGEIA